MLRIKKSRLLKTQPPIVFSAVVLAKLQVSSNSRKSFKLIREWIQVRCLSITINWALKPLKHPKIASKCYLIRDRHTLVLDWYRIRPPTKRLFKMSLCLFLASLWRTDLCSWAVLKAFLALEKVRWEILSLAQPPRANSERRTNEASYTSRMTFLGLRVRIYSLEDWAQDRKHRDSSKVEMELQLMLGSWVATRQTEDSQ